MTSPVPVAVPPTLPRHPKGLKVDLHASSTSAPAAPATTRPPARKASTAGVGAGEEAGAGAGGAGRSLGGSQSFRGRSDSWNLDLNMTLQQWNDLQGVGTPTAAATGDAGMQQPEGSVVQPEGCGDGGVGVEALVGADAVGRTKAAGVDVGECALCKLLGCERWSACSHFATMNTCDCHFGTHGAMLVLMV